MDEKLKITVEKNIEGLARIERFIVKYGDKLTENQIKKISQKLQELQKKIGN